VRQAAMAATADETAVTAFKSNFDKKLIIVIV
jgi:hypothetical protein